MASASRPTPPRVQAWKDALTEADMDAAILFEPQYVQHTTGFNALINSMPSVSIVLPGDEDPILLVNALRFERAKETAFTSNIYGYGNFFGNPSIADTLDGALLELFRKYQLCDRQIGFMTGGITVKQFKALKLQFPKADFTEADETFAPLRHVKDTDEIEMTRIAGKIADAGAKAGIEAINNGSTEQEVKDIVDAAMAAFRRQHYPKIEVSDFGNSHSALFNGNQSWCLSGPRTKVSCDAPSDRVPKRGERVFLLIWATAGGYHAEKELMWFVDGVAPAQDIKVVRDVRDAMDKMYALLKPGTSLGEVHLAGERHLFACGWQGWTASRNGHSIGLDPHEEPSMSAASKLVLKPGMFVTVEPNVSKRGAPSTRISETVEITMDGYQFVTDPAIGKDQPLQQI